MATNAAPASSTCDSCGDATDELTTVRRIYVSADISPPDADHVVGAGDEGSLTRSDELERWCYPCRTMYPHEAEAPADT